MRKFLTVYLYLGLLATERGTILGAEVDVAEIGRLIGQLGNDYFKVRETASRKLNEIGEAALPALQKAADSSNAEVRRRVAHLSEAIHSRLHQQALAAIEQLGGYIQRAGDGGPVVNIVLSGVLVTDKDLMQLKAFRELAFLDLYFP